MKKRVQLTRRSLNDCWYGFGDPLGNFSWQKFIAVWGQIMLIFQTGVNFPELIKNWEALTICLCFIIAPKTIEKFLNLKYGAATK